MDIQQLFDTIVQACRNSTAADIHLLKDAFEQSKQALTDRWRENGDPFIAHALEVARILVQDIGLQASVATAVLLHESFDHAKIIDLLGDKKGELEFKMQEKALSAIVSHYGMDIAQMVKGMNRISAINLRDTKLEPDNLRKFFVLYSDDPRVTIIKLADRLEVMRSLEFFPKQKQEKKAAETLLLYAPLAHQLGLYNIKRELEDLSLRFTEPEAYRLINNKLKSTVTERQQLIDDFLVPVEQELKRKGLKYEIKSRTKSIYSIWRKMQAQKVSFEGVFDIFAIRIIIDAPFDDRKKEVELCWDAFAVIETFYKTDTKRTRDWLTTPRASGYESLHTTATTKQGKTIEVQIRTVRMDMVAERGSAAHWKYKGLKGSDNLQDFLDNIRALLETPESQYKHYFPNFKSDEIFVFTPTGELKRLSAGASVLDFAFEIHTNIGLRCSGATVNGKHVPIKEKLSTGDVVAITTTKNQKPVAAWLDFVVSSKAKNKIRQKLLEAELKLTLAGKELLERRLKNWKIEFNDDVLNVLLKHFKLKSILELYAAIADEKINISNVRELLTGKPAEKKPERIIRRKTDNDKVTTTGIDYLVTDVKGLANSPFVAARCCSTDYGEEVFGFITRGVIKVHNYNCPNADRLLDKEKEDKQVKLRWLPKPE